MTNPVDLAYTCGKTGRSGIHTHLRHVDVAHRLHALLTSRLLLQQLLFSADISSVALGCHIAHCFVSEAGTGRLPVGRHRKSVCGGGRLGRENPITKHVFAEGRDL